MRTIGTGARILQTACYFPPRAFHHILLYVSQPNATAEVTIWADAPGSIAVGSVLDLMGAAVTPIGIGGLRVSEVDDLARRLDCPRYDDLRQLLVDKPARFLLLATLQSATPEELATALNQGTTILALEPVAGDLVGLDALRSARKALAGTGVGIVMLPDFQQSPGFLSAADPREVLGNQRLISFESIGSRGMGSLYARLYDGWQTVLSFADLPETIDASLLGMPQIPDDLPEMTGRIAAHARMSTGGTALLQVADHGSEHRRSMTVLGQQGQLRLTDAGYELRGQDAEPLDQAQQPGPMSFADLVAGQWRRLLDRSPGTHSTPDTMQHTLACCLATLLSARTGQPESPNKLLQLRR